MRNSVPIAVSDAVARAFTLFPLQRTPYWRWDIMEMYQRYPSLSFNLLPNGMEEAVLKDAIRFYRSIRSPRSRRSEMYTRFPHIARAFYTYIDRSPRSMCWLIEACLLGTKSDEDVVKIIASETPYGFDPNAETSIETLDQMASMGVDELALLDEASHLDMSYTEGDDHLDMMSWVSAYRKLFFDVRQYGRRKRLVGYQAIRPARSSATIDRDFDYAWKMLSFILGARRFCKMIFFEESSSELDREIKGIIRTHLSSLALQAAGSIANEAIERIVEILRVSKDYLSDTDARDDKFEQAEKNRMIIELRGALTLVMKDPDNPPSHTETVAAPDAFADFSWEKANANKPVTVVGK